MTRITILDATVTVLRFRRGAVCENLSLLRKVGGFRLIQPLPVIILVTQSLTAVHLKEYLYHTNRVLKHST